MRVPWEEQLAKSIGSIQNIHFVEIAQRNGVEFVLIQNIVQCFDIGPHFLQFVRLVRPVANEKRLFHRGCTQTQAVIGRLKNDSMEASILYLCASLICFL